MESVLNRLSLRMLETQGKDREIDCLGICKCVEPSRVEDGDVTVGNTQFFCFSCFWVAHVGFDKRKKSLSKRTAERCALLRHCLLAALQKDYFFMMF